jgi:hypothetical protein
MKGTHVNILDLDTGLGEASPDGLNWSNTYIVPRQSLLFSLPSTVHSPMIVGSTATTW